MIRGVHRRQWTFATSEAVVAILQTLDVKSPISDIDLVFSSLRTETQRGYYILTTKIGSIYTGKSEFRVTKANDHVIYKPWINLKVLDANISK